MGKFKIPEIPPTINKTIRFPSDVVQAVEQAIQGKECTFSAFVIAAVRAALEDLSEYAYRLKSAAHPLASPIGGGGPRKRWRGCTSVGRTLPQSRLAP